MRMLVIGLTGGIGSGKSTVARIFSQLGSDMISMDKIAHELTQQDQPAYRQITDLFAPEILLADGNLDRKKLGQLIFSDSDKRIKLESILHPKINQRVKENLQNCCGDIVIVEIPLLREKSQFPYLDRILVIDAEESIRISRVEIRDNLNKTEIKAIINTQVKADMQKSLADDIINNNGLLDELTNKVENLYKFYLTISKLV